MTDLSTSCEQALQRFGLTEFRPGQREVIETIVAGHDCMCVMPTGGGKSLCYQLPSLIRPGLTIVVSPLIALMKDQVDALGRRGIPAALINSTLSQSEQQQSLQDVAAGKYQLVYVAPERLRNNRFMEAIRATPIQLLAIDEAHCISQWGHDFRPDYTRIGKFREWLGGVQTIALTATATPRVREDIVQVLGMKRPKQFMSGFARPNLHFGVVQRANDREKDEELEKFIGSATGSGIIYSATRKRCEAIVELLSEKLKISVGAYHAGLMADQRRAVQERFMKNELRIIVATNAFGMGIDKPDLRFVIHYNMPGSLEAYYQEAGRAGRDGEQSQCVMLYSFQDRYIQEFFIDNNYPSREVIEKVYNFLAAREEDPIELTLEEIRDALGLNISPEAVGSALQIIGRTHVLERLEMGGGLAIVRIESNLPTLVDMLPRESKTRRKVLRMLERAVGDRRYEQVHIHPRWLLQESGMQRDALMRALRELNKLEAFDYIPPFRGRAVHFLKRGVAFADLGIDFENLNKRKEAEYDRLNQVVQYAQTPLCRQATILRYFGDTSAENCGQCDRCGRVPGWPKFDVVPPPVKANLVKTVSAGDAMQLTATAADREAVSQAPASQPSASQPSVSQPSVSQPSMQTTLALNPAVTPQSASSVAKKITPAQQLQFLAGVVDAIKRIHGRLGKLLIAQYLCGSQSAKLQKLHMHRLGGFGMLANFRQSDAVALLEALLASGILKQQEVNRNRPTVSVAPELMDAKLRDELLSTVVLPAKLEAKIAPLVKSSQPSQPEELFSSTRQSSTTETAATKPLVVNPSPAKPDAVERVVGAEPSSGLPAAAHRDAQPSAAAPVSVADWEWTIRLFQARFAWSEVLSARRLSDPELATSLCEAAQHGAKIERHWLSGVNDELRTAGQQRVLRELQRRAAAGVSPR